MLAGLIPGTPESRSRVSFVTEGEASLHFAINNGLVPTNMNVCIYYDRFTSDPMTFARMGKVCSLSMLVAARLMSALTHGGLTRMLKSLHPSVSATSGSLNDN